MRRVKNEIIKRNADDYLFPCLQKRIGKKYANEEGILYSVEDIEYYSKKAKKIEQKGIRTNYGGMLVVLLLVVSWLLLLGFELVVIKLFTLYRYS